MDNTAGWMGGIKKKKKLKVLSVPDSTRVKVINPRSYKMSHKFVLRHVPKRNLLTVQLASVCVWYLL